MQIVIVLMGIPGSGKTTVANILRRTCRLSLISRDEIRAGMFQPCEFTEVEKEAAYRGTLLALDACLRLGRSCIIDGMTFSNSRTLTEVREVVQKRNVHFLPVLLDVPVETAQKRVEADVLLKKHFAMDRNPELVKTVARKSDYSSPDVLRIDGTRSPEEVAHSIAKKIPELN